jgi:hypothetical protein
MNSFSLKTNNLLFFVMEKQCILCGVRRKFVCHSGCQSSQILIELPYLFAKDLPSLRPTFARRSTAHSVVTFVMMFPRARIKQSAPRCPLQLSFLLLYFSCFKVLTKCFRKDSAYQTVSSLLRSLLPLGRFVTRLLLWLDSKPKSNAVLTASLPAHIQMSLRRKIKVNLLYAHLYISLCLCRTHDVAPTETDRQYL